MNTFNLDRLCKSLIKNNRYQKIKTITHSHNGVVEEIKIESIPYRVWIHTNKNEYTRLVYVENDEKDPLEERDLKTRLDHIFFLD